MNLFQTIILSMVEGITEFLPISSTGHLILASNLLKITQTEFVKSFEIIIQLGAILAVVVIYFKKLVLSFNLDLYKKLLIAQGIYISLIAEKPYFENVEETVLDFELITGDNNIVINNNSLEIPFIIELTPDNSFSLLKVKSSKGYGFESFFDLQEKKKFEYNSSDQK